MNPLTLVKRTQKINSTEAALGISEEASWHAKYKDSAYVFVGGIPYDLTEGDLLAVFAQYGEVVDVNLVRDKGTGKSKGFAFLAYEDQRSTILAVDNLNGAKVLGRIVRVDHVSKYKKKEEEENDEEEQQKREARGVCRAFQRGDCNRGTSCKFSHDEQRCANTGWGSKDDDPKWNHDKYDGPPKSHKDFSHNTKVQSPPYEGEGRGFKSKSTDRDGHSSRLGADEHYHSNSQRKRSDSGLKDSERRGSENISGKRRSEQKSEDNDMQTRDKGDLERRGSEKTSEKRRSESKLEDRDIQMKDKFSGMRKSNPNQVHDVDGQGSEKRSGYGGGSSKHYHQEDDRRRSAHR